MPAGFIYRTGPHDFVDEKTTASTALARGDAVKFTSAALVVATTGAKVYGIMQGVKAVGDALTTFKQVLKLDSGRTQFEAYEKRASGSLAASDEKVLHDLTGSSGAMGFDSSATSHNDLFLQKVTATGATGVGRARVIFGDPSWLTAAVV